MHPQLSICTLLCSESLAESLSQVMSGDRYTLYITHSESEFLDWVDRQKQHIDCLVLEDDYSLLPVINRLYEQGTLFPIVILAHESQSLNYSVITNNQHDPTETTLTAPKPEGEYCLPGEANHLFHAAEVRLNTIQLSEIGGFIDQAITRFLSLSPTWNFSDSPATVHQQTELTNQSFLMEQQRRLSEKLKERLGYLGVYYKRNPQLFFRYLSERERQQLLEKLKSDYREIVLKYFSQDNRLNQEIDTFVHQVFFADISLSKIVEIHMDLMDDFSKQLKLEGRSEEMLLDYRLTLIDVIAHLGEMYRRSIPREL
ncbi:MAG TPA: circadian clock protein KaiA [Cyanobacteria bacterium UBA11162]|nr:circadian clock protein KaiA [Cyanobacteria bacterium UBA11162]